MPTEQELLDAIKDIESKESSFENCIKLSVFYYLYDRYYNRNQDFEKNNSYKYKNGSVESLIRNKDIEDIIDLFLEILECIEITNPKLYENIIDRLK
jgi:hypothetical protein